MNVMSDWVVYLLTCSDQTLYCGMTNNLSARINKHNSGKGSKYTCSRLPVQLYRSFACVDKVQAMRAERAVKRLSRAEKLALTDELFARLIYNLTPPTTNKDTI